MSESEVFTDLRFCASIDTRLKGPDCLVDVYPLDSPKAVMDETENFERFAKKIVFKFVKISEKGNIIFSPNSRKVEDGYLIEMERFEEAASEDSFAVMYHICLRVKRQTEYSLEDLVKRIEYLETENNLLRQEIQKLIDLVEKIENIKEAFRIPFDAIKDLLISFDCKGNVMVVNQASSDWFGLTPREIVKKKYRTILEQNIPDVIQKVCETQCAQTIEEQVGNKYLQITYIPMTNKKNGQTEVVMLAQDITRQKAVEKEQEDQGASKALNAMGVTMRHILNSSLNAILGFAQLGLSSYHWPRETMHKYFRLIEKTARRMKKEISLIAEQKELKTARYLEHPDFQDTSEILQVELGRRDGD